MHVSNIKSVINSPDGEPWSFDLGEKVILVGRNGTGKSSVSIAIQIALTGIADEVDGRYAVKDPGRLFEMAPADELWAFATLSDGSTSGWGTSRVDGVIKEPKTPPEYAATEVDVFPLRAVREVIQGDAKIARRRFLAWIGQTKTQEDVLASLPSHLHARYRDVAEAKGKAKDAPETPVAMLAAVTEYATARAREIEKEAKAQDALIAGMAPSGIRPSDEALTEAQRAVDAWTVAHAACLRWEAWQVAQAGAANREAAEVALAQAEVAVAGWQGALRAAEAREVPAVVVAEGMTRMQAAQGLLDLAVGESNCPACSSPVGAAHLENCRAFFAGQISALQATSAAAAAEAEAAREQCALAIREASQAVAGWYAEAARLRGVLSATAPAGEAPANPGMTADHAQAQVTTARAALADLQKRRTEWDTLGKARDAAAALRAEKPAYEDLAKHCQAAVGDLLAASAADFTARVQKWIGGDYVFGIDLGTPERPALRFGFVRDGVLRTYKSAAQGEILRAALTMAVCDLGARRKRGAEVPLRIVIPADRRVDPETLQDQMRVWAKFPGQVILEATAKPGRVSKDWTVIDMDEWLAKRMPAAPAAPVVDVPAVAASTVKDVPPANNEGQISGPPTLPSTLPPSAPVRTVAEAVADLRAGHCPALPMPPPPPSPVTAVDAGHLRTLGYDPDVLGQSQAAYVMKNGVPASLTQILADGTLRILNASGRPVFDIRPDPTA